MKPIFAALKPAAVWEQFERIAAIPRPSKKEEKIITHVMKIAQEHHLETVRDPAGNVLVRKPASRGKESMPAVSLQSHLDMVCEKNASRTIDFDHDGITPVRSDGWITADGTTLGADNGIGVAAAISVMLDPSLVHGPLELLFTVDEETGLTGAHALDPGLLKSRVMLNLDSEEEGELFVGCSGGRDSVITVPIRRQAPGSSLKPFMLAVKGLKGGHSGLDIDKGRANAIQLMARMLKAFMTHESLAMASIAGGSKRNAIPRECVAVFWADPGGLPERVFLCGSFPHD
jgi:dipeptidase D